MFMKPAITTLPQEQLTNAGVRTTPSGLKLEDSKLLRKDIETIYGKSQKDYNKYLEATVFPYALSDKIYNFLLTKLQRDFKRKYFKKVFTHILRYADSITEQNLNIISDLCLEHKFAITLTEMANLMINRGLINTVDKFVIISSRLQQFKEFGDNLVFLTIQYSNKNNGEFSGKMLAGHLDILIKFKLEARYMLIFDKVRVDS